MRSFVRLASGSFVVLAVLAACVGDDPAPSSSSSASSSGNSSSGGSSGAASSSGTTSSGGNCPGNTTDACGASCTKCTTPTGGTVACTDGKCVGSCTAPQTLCTDACVDTKTTKEQCGACGHNCNGGGCVDGQCQPIQIASATKMLWFDVAAAGVVMSMDDTKVRLCDIPTGCSEAQLKSIASGLSWNAHVVVSGTTVFFDGQTGDPYLVYKCAITGCPGTGPDVVENIVNDSIGNIVAGPTDLVWTRRGYYGPYTNKCVLPGCAAPLTVRPAPPSSQGYYGDVPSRELDTPNHIISVGANTTLWSTGGIYATSTPFLRSCPLSTTTCTPTDITNAAGVLALTYYSGKHYGVENAANGEAIFTVVDTAGTSTRTVIAGDDDGITDIAVDASGIYWVNGTTGFVRRCPNLTGCTAAQNQTLATNQTGAKHIRLDAGNVYWMTDTKVLRVVKP